MARPSEQRLVNGMQGLYESTGYSDYRVLDRDRIEVRDIRAMPNPSRLRAACLMIYAGLLLTLGAMLSSAQAGAAGHAPVQPAAQIWTAADVRQNRARAIVRTPPGVAGLEEDAFHSLPFCDQTCQVMSFSRAMHDRVTLDSGGFVESIRYPSGGRLRPGQLLFVIAVLVVLLLVLSWRIVGLRGRDRELNRIVEERTRKLKEMSSRLEALSRTDETTGIANHRRLRFYLAEQWQVCGEGSLPVTLILMDVDCFKQFNDKYGHQAGDEFLHAMAQSLSRLVVAEGGLLARYGGAEFLAVLPRRTLSEGVDVAESLRNAVISLEYRRASDGNGNCSGNRFVTASFGVASVLPEIDTAPEDLIRRAGQAMYEAKRAGRDRVCTA